MATAVLRSAMGLIGGRLSQPITSFFLFWVSARVLPLAEFGVYVQLMSLLLLFQAISNLGLGQIVGREIGKSIDRSGEFTGSALLLSVPATLLACLLLVLTVWVLQGHKVEATQYSILLALTLPLSVCIQLAEAVFTAHGEGKTLFSYNLAEQLTNTTIGSTALLLGYGLWGLFFAYTAGRCLSFFWSLTRLRRLAVPFSFSISRGALRQFAGYLPVFSTMTIVASLYFRMDILILSHFADEKTLGIYGCAMRFLTICFIVPESISAAWLPHLASLWGPQRGEFSRSGTMALQLSFALCIIGAACLVGFAAIGLVPIFGAKFAGSIPVLGILACTLPAHSLNVHLGLCLQAAQLENMALGLVLFGLACVAVLVTLGTWQWGVHGTAAGMVAASWCLGLAHLYKTRKILLLLPASHPVLRGIWLFLPCAMLPAILLPGIWQTGVTLAGIAAALLFSHLAKTLNPARLRATLAPGRG